MAASSRKAHYKQMRVSTLESLEEAFLTEIKDLVSDIRSAIMCETTPVEEVDTAYNKACLFLQQTVPTLSGAGEVVAASTDTTTFKDELKHLQGEVSNLKTHLITVTSDLSSERAKSRRLDQKLSSMVKDLKKEQTNNRSAQLLAEQNIGRMRTFMSRYMKSQADLSHQAAQSQPGGASSNPVAVSQALGPPQSATVERRFDAATTGDEETPAIQSVALLPSGLVVVGAWGNTAVKVFDQQGQYLHQWSAPGSPRVCVVDDAKVAVVYGDCEQFHILAIKRSCTKVEGSYNTTKHYGELTRLSQSTLAARCVDPHDGFDVLDLTGKIIRSLRTEFPPWFRCLSTQGTLVCSDLSTIFEVDCGNGQTLARKQVKQIQDPCGIAVTKDSSYIVLDRQKDNLSLLGPDLSFTRELWSAQAGEIGRDDGMMNVCVDGDICVCVSVRGKVFVMRLSYN